MGRRRTHAPSSAFGAYLERQLREQGLKPADFAARAGLSASHVYQLLRGDRADPRATTFSKVAAAMQLTEAQLARAVFSNGSAAPADPLAGPGVDKATFFGIMSAFPTGVAIVSTLDEAGQPRGLTCTATCSVSADPPLLLVCVDRHSHTLPALRSRRRFVVNYLLSGRGELSNLFATHQPDKWAHVAWRPTRTGMPWLHADSLAHAECSVVQEMDGGDHVIVVGRVEDGHAPPPGTQPLMYFRRSYGTWPD